MQVDVVEINWQAHDILLSECKWGADALNRKTVRELLAKASLVLADLPNKGAGWRIHRVLFARAGATPAAHAELTAKNGTVVDLTQLARYLTALA